MTSLVTNHDRVRGLVGLEHLSMTVPDLDEAADFFVEVFGCERFYDQGPFGGGRDHFMRTYGNVDVRARVERMTVLRSPLLNVELFQVTYPGQRTLWPQALDIGGWSLAACVDDVDKAVAWLADTGVYLLDADPGPTGMAHCMTSFGLRFELLSVPLGRTEAGFDPREPSRDATPAPPEGGLPGFRGFEHLTMTVPDLNETADFLMRVLGFTHIGGSAAGRSATDGRGTPSYPNSDVRAVIHDRVLLASPDLNLQLLQATSPGQVTQWPAMLDVGGWHLAYYVEDMDAAIDSLRPEDCSMLGPKKPRAYAEAGEDGYTLHAVTSYGFAFELVTFPNGQEYEKHFPRRLWHPGRPADA